MTLYKLEKANRWRCVKCLNEKTKRYRDKCKEMAVEYKGGCCEICGYNKHLGSLEFHHINPSNKDFDISSKVRPKQFDTIKKELDKCILVCANCHREIHGGLIEPS